MPLATLEALLANFCYQFYTVNGALPSKAICIQQGVDGAQYDKCFKNTEFLENLRLRGVRIPKLNAPLNDDDETVGLGALSDAAVTDRQLLALDAWFDRNDRRSFPKKLTDLAITSAEWATWQRDPVFQSYMRQRAEQLFRTMLPEAQMAMGDQVRAGNFDAIKYYMKMSGYYDPDASNLDGSALLMGVIEIITKHIADPSVLQNVAQDLLELGKEHKVVRPDRTISSAAVGTPVGALPVGLEHM